MHFGTYPPDINTKISMFFLRTTPGTVQVPGSIDEANNILPQYFDFGILNSHPLFMLSQMLTKIYTPLLSYRGNDKDDHLMHQFAIKQKGEEDAQQEQNQVVDKVDDEKAARVSNSLHS